MRVLVCGGRDFNDIGFIFAVLDEFHRVNTITELIEGDARGVDRIAGGWARDAKIKNTKFKADWKKWDKAAGPIRNQKMLDEGKPETVIAFPGGTGTADMIERSERACVPVVRVARP